MGAVRPETCSVFLYLVGFLRVCRLCCTELRMLKSGTIPRNITSNTEFEACPILKSYVVKSDKNLQNLDLSSFPVDVVRTFLRNRLQISSGLQRVISQKRAFFSHSHDQLKYQLSFEKVICQNYTSICFCYVGLFVCVCVFMFVFTWFLWYLVLCLSVLGLTIALFN
jgi:hypothetical protein